MGESSALEYIVECIEYEKDIRRAIADYKKDPPKNEEIEAYFLDNIEKIEKLGDWYEFSEIFTSAKLTEYLSFINSHADIFNISKRKRKKRDSESLFPINANWDKIKNESGAFINNNKSLYIRSNPAGDKFVDVIEKILDIGVMGHPIHINDKVVISDGDAIFTKLGDFLIPDMRYSTSLLSFLTHPDIRVESEPVNIEIVYTGILVEDLDLKCLLSHLRPYIKLFLRMSEAYDIPGSFCDCIDISEHSIRDSTRVEDMFGVKFERVDIIIVYDLEDIAMGG